MTKNYKRITTNVLQEMKDNKEKISMLTSYDFTLAKIVDNAGIDVILVGDSVATAFYGMKNTRSISLNTIINHSIAVGKGIKKSTFVVDMPFNTYRNINEAKKNVKKVLLRTNCDAIKLESNGKNFKIIKTLTNSGVKVMGHIGYTPQYKKTCNSAK